MVAAHVAQPSAIERSTGDARMTSFCSGWGAITTTAATIARQLTASMQGGAAEHADEHAAQSRPRDHRQLVEAEVERQRRAQARGLDEVRKRIDERRTFCRAPNPASSLAEDVERPAAGEPKREQRQRAERTTSAILVEQQQAAAIGAVGDGAAEQRHGHERTSSIAPSRPAVRKADPVWT